MESRECPKCRSLNEAGAPYCRYCHERFNQAKTFVEKKKNKWLNRKLLIAAGGGILAATGYLWRKKKSSKTN